MCVWSPLGLDPAQPDESPATLSRRTLMNIVLGALLLHFENSFRGLAFPNLEWRKSRTFASSLLSANSAPLGKRQEDSHLILFAILPPALQAG